MKKYYFFNKFFYFFGFVLIPTFFAVSCYEIKQKKIEIKSQKYNFSIIQYSKNNNFFLNENELNILIQNIENKLFFGPEINFLKNIIIDQDILFFQKKNNLNNEGKFISNTQQIFINTDKYRNIKKSNDKIEILTQLIYHEYIHYLDSVYLSNKEEIKENNVIKFSNKQYLKKFVQNFFKYLNYTNDKFINFKPNLSFVEKNNFFNFKTANEIAKLNMQKELTNNYFLDKKNKMFSVYAKNGLLTQKNETLDFLINYYYSLEEIIAIEIFKHFYLPNKNTINYDQNSFLNEWSRTAKIIRKNDNFFIENLFVNTTAFSGKILNNDDFILELDNQIELLYNLLLKQFNYGLNISAVFYKDETYLTNDSKIKNTRNFSNYSFVGYTKEKYDFLILQNKNNENIKVNLNYQNKEIYKAKKSFDSASYNLLSNDYYVYTSDFFNIEEINEQFFPKFWKDKNNNGKIEPNELVVANNFTFNNKTISSKRSFFDNLSYDHQFIIINNFENKKWFKIVKKKGKHGNA
ncbi:MYPU_1760 family metalloprotease [Mesomycoplasma neurolyticum]|uniref:Lipoprotein n=1 Tax=Mesomycoplasma neurolyticum TaxID=2120 RepID=A0A449A6A2_9BACT|nr:hypothetical protein [Mesomycoplasma neurolyticum]VEU59764.1 Uncharacterised protein [Mesomycoplasma neurolyticum]